MPPHPSITIGKSWRILIPLGIGLAICLASYWYWNYRRIAEVGDAARLAYRQRNSVIKDFEELKKVPGVSAEKLQAKRGLIAFSL